MNDKSQQSAKQYLDDRSNQLSKKHSATLVNMTEHALNSATKTPFFELFKPTVAWAFSVLFVVGVMYNFYGQLRPNNETNMAALPAWVSDTQVPLPVIEQLEFYTWLAQNIEDNDEALQTMSKNQAVETGVDRVFKFGYRQQLAALDAPQRLFGEFNVIRIAE